MGVILTLTGIAIAVGVTWLLGHNYGYSRGHKIGYQIGYHNGQFDIQYPKRSDAGPYNTL